jgi:hypothetical protein
MKIGKLILISILGIVFFISCNSNDDLTEYQNELNSFIYENYWEDAKQIYQNEVANNTNHFNYDLEYLDSLEIVKISKNIQSVYELTIPEQDSIFNQYQIHANIGYIFTELTLKVEDNQSVGSSETMNLILPSSNENELFDFYNNNQFVFTQSVPIATNWVDVKFNDNKNLTFLKNNLLDISFITNVEIGPFLGGVESKMKFERFENYNITTFRMGWGDCWAGCIIKRYWKFKTTEDSAEFIESYYGNEF